MNSASAKHAFFFFCAILNFMVTCAAVISLSGDEKTVQTKDDLSDRFRFINGSFVRHNVSINTIHFLPKNNAETQRENGKRGNVEHFIPDTQVVNISDYGTTSNFEYLFRADVKRYRRATSGIKDSFPSEDELENSTSISTSNFNKLNESVIETEVDDYSSKYKNEVVSGSGVQLHFPACPAGETIVVESFEEHYLPFSVFSVLMEFLQPAEFPLSLLKELQQKRIPFHVLLLQVIKLEGLLLLWIVLWAILSLWIPWSVISKICCIRKKRNRLENHSSISSINIRNRFSERFVGCFLHTILFFLLLNLLLMLGSNEQISKSLAQSPEKAETILEDLQRFVRNTEMQISFVTTTSIEFTLSTVEKDLNDIENILGTPFKNHIGEIYELDHVFRTLDYIQTYSVDVSRRVKLMTQESLLAGDAVKQFQEKLQELMPFIDNIDHQCSQKDRPLCETIILSRFDVSFNIQEVISDENLKYLERISYDEDFNKSLAEAELNYNNIPRRVFHETELQRDDVRKSLMKRRTSTDSALRSLEDISRFVTSNIKSGNKILIPLLEVIASWDFWRYLVVLTLSILIFIMWICLMCGAPCGCDVNKASVSYMVIAFYLASILSLFIWAMGTIALLFGAHTQNIVCKSFHDPNYKLFHQLLDNNGLIYPRGGLLKRLLKSNETINISDILRFAEINAGAFSTLRLHHKINLNTLTNYNSWDDFNYSLQNLQIETKNIKLLTYKLESTLLELQKTLQVNLTYYRLSLQKPVLGKDLNAYLDQTYSVSKQISNVRTRSMFEKLIFKLTDIINNEYRYLSEKRERIIYHVTALEIILKPLIEKTHLVFRKIAHYETAFIKNSRSIGREHVKIFTSRIHNYLEQLNRHVTREIQSKVARLKPLWSIFQATKVTFCDEFISPVNSLSFSCYLSILLIMCLLPIGTRIFRSYRECYEEIHPLTKRNGSDETVHETEQQIWTTPRIETTPGTPETIARNVDEESAWVSPRQSVVSEPHAPPPPRPPSASRRNPSPRAPLPTVTKSRSPFTRYDSLKLIEESSSTWKSRASPARPRNWI